MEIDYRLIDPETLRNLISEYVTRDGTDYGDREISHETKIEQVRRQLEQGRIVLVFDAESESCDLREKTLPPRPRPDQTAT